MPTPSQFDGFGTALAEGLGRCLWVTDADRTRGAWVPVKLRVFDEEDFASSADGGRIATRGNAMFATDAAPDAATGWIIQDCDGALWEMQAPRRSGHGVTRCDLKRVLT